MALIGQVVSDEKMFEYYGDIHVCCPGVEGVGAYEPLGSYFSESLIFRPTAHFLQDFHFKLQFKSFPQSNALASDVDLVVKGSWFIYTL